MIQDYIVTYKYAMYTTKNEKQKNKIIEKMLLSKMAVFSIDAAMFIYVVMDKKINPIAFEVDYKYGRMEATFNIDEEFESLPDFFKIYITSTLSSTVFERNLIPNHIENDYITLFLAPVILSTDINRIFAYPIVKFYRSGIIMVDFSIYSAEVETEPDQFVNFVLNTRICDFEQVQIDTSVLDYHREKYDEVEKIATDEIQRNYGVYNGSGIHSLKDLAFYLVSTMIDEDVGYIARQNYSIESSEISDTSIQSLLNGVSTEAIKDFIPEEYKNYREFTNSYSLYANAGTTVTIGEITETRTPSLVIDDMFMYLAVKISQLRAMINSNRKSLESINELYSDVVNTQGYLLNGLNSYLFSKRIFDDLFAEYRMHDQMNNIKELIEVEIKKLEIKRNKSSIASQNWIALVVAFLSSEMIVKYFTRPLYLRHYALRTEQLSIEENMLLFSIPVLLVMMIILLRKGLRVFK